MAKKQGKLGLVGDGVEQTTIKELESAAEAYVVARDARMGKSKVEKEQKTALIDVMRSLRRNPRKVGRR